MANPVITQDNIAFWFNASLGPHPIIGPDWNQTTTSDVYVRNQRGFYTKKTAGQYPINWQDGKAGLFTERESQNEVTDSNDFSAGSDWNGSGDFTLTTATSLFLGQTAYKHENAGTGGNLGRDQVIGTLTGSPETFSAIVENVDGTYTDIGIYDNTAGSFVVLGRLTWADGSFSITDTTAGSDEAFSVLDLGTGPNGGQVYRIAVSATPSNSGNARKVILYPSGTTTNSEFVVVHHTQHEEMGYPTSPIVTTTSAVARNVFTPSITLTGNMTDPTTKWALFCKYRLNWGTDEMLPSVSYPIIWQIGDGHQVTGVAGECMLRTTLRDFDPGAVYDFKMFVEASDDGISSAEYVFDVGTIMDQYTRWDGVDSGFAQNYVPSGNDSESILEGVGDAEWDSTVFGAQSSWHGSNTLYFGGRDTGEASYEQDHSMELLECLIVYGDFSSYDQDVEPIEAFRQFPCIGVS